MTGIIPLPLSLVLTTGHTHTQEAAFLVGAVAQVCLSLPLSRAVFSRLSLDYLIHQYGTNEDWNRMANVSGDLGWAWNNMKQYIKRVCCAAELCPNELTN